jgi:hypothetical protein
MVCGPAMQRIALKGDGSNCDYLFELHQSYLVYAYVHDNGMMEASKCNRTRPLAAATEDLKYLEGVRDGRAQVVIHGVVLRRGLDKDGQLQLYGWPKPCELQVFAMSQGVLFSTATEPSGAYQSCCRPAASRSGSNTLASEFPRRTRSSWKTAPIASMRCPSIFSIRSESLDRRALVTTWHLVRLRSSWLFQRLSCLGLRR